MKEHLESSIFGDQDDPHGTASEAPPASPPPRTRRELREAELAARKRGSRAPKSGSGRSKPSLLRRLGVILLALVVVGGGVAVAYTFLRPVIESFLESNDYPGPGTGEVQVTVEPGAGGSAIGRMLAEEDVVKSSKAFIEAARNDPKSAGIQPGVYEMRKQMSAAEALDVLIDPKNRITTQVTIPEGLWAKEIYAKLSAVTGIPVADYAAAAKNPDELGLPAAAKGNVEGYLFPASYTFDPDTTATDHLKQMVSESVSR